MSILVPGLRKSGRPVLDCVRSKRYGDVRVFDGVSVPSKWRRIARSGQRRGQVDDDAVLYASKPRMRAPARRGHHG